MAFAVCTRFKSVLRRCGKPSGCSPLRKGFGSRTPAALSLQDSLRSLARLAVPHGGAQCKNSTTPGCLKSDLRYWTASSLARSSAMVACNCLWRFYFWSMDMTLKPRAYKVAESLAHPAHNSMQRSEFIGAPWKVELFGETEGPAASAGRHCCSQLFWLCAPPHLVHT